MEMRGQTISYCVFNATALTISSENALSCRLYVGIVAREGILLVHVGLCKSKVRRVQTSTTPDQGITPHRIRAILQRDSDPTKMGMALTSGITMSSLDHNSARIRSMEDMMGETLANKDSIGNKGDSDQMAIITLVMGSNTITNNNTTTSDHIIMSMHWNLLNKKIDLLNRR